MAVPCTHHIPYFTRYQHGHVLAACDTYVAPAAEAPPNTEPTCARCRHWLSEVVDNNKPAGIHSALEVPHGEQQHPPQPRRQQ